MVPTAAPIGHELVNRKSIHQVATRVSVALLNKKDLDVIDVS